MSTASPLLFFSYPYSFPWAGVRELPVLWFERFGYQPLLTATFTYKDADKLPWFLEALAVGVEPRSS